MTPLFVTLLGIAGQPVMAQLSLGLEGGYNYNYLSKDLSGRWFSENDGQAGYTIGVPVLYQCNSWLMLCATPSFCKKNYLSKRTDTFAGIYEYHYNNYLQLPLTARYVFKRKRFDVFLELGVYSAWWISGRIKGVAPNLFDLHDSAGANGQLVEYIRLDAYEMKYHFDTRKDNRFEWGWVTGIGGEYHLNAQYALFIEGRYTGSLSDRQKKYMKAQPPEHNHTFYLSAGGTVRLKTKRRSTKKNAA